MENVMRKSILLGLMAVTALPTMAVPSAASAQNHREIRRDRQELREDRRELRQDRRSGESAREIRHDRREVRRDRREVRRDRTAYIAPYRGWRYRAVTPGFRLRPGFYGSRYLISNYGHYRLRAPSVNQRWVRYGNDLLLVNIRNGRVIQVIRNRY
jgi:Ni/Co efflux regulator RcnB